MEVLSPVRCHHWLPSSLLSYFTFSSLFYSLLAWFPPIRHNFYYLFFFQFVSEYTGIMEESFNYPEIFIYNVQIYLLSFHLQQISYNLNLSIMKIPLQNFFFYCETDINPISYLGYKYNHVLFFQLIAQDVPCALQQNILYLFIETSSALLLKLPVDSEV